MEDACHLSSNAVIAVDEYIVREDPESTKGLTQLPGGVVGVVQLEQQEVVNNTIQDEGAAELQPPGHKTYNLLDFFYLGQESEEYEGTLGEEVDAVGNIARQIEGEISKYQTLSLLPFYGNAKVFADPLIWWEKKKVSVPHPFKNCTKVSLHSRYRGTK
jgi:hypothetical protein